MNFSVYIEYIIFILYNEHIYTKIHRILFAFLVSSPCKVPEMGFNKGIEGNRTIIIKCSMERENGRFAAFGGFCFLCCWPLFSPLRVCCAVGRCGDVRGGLAGRLAEGERRGKTGGGEDRGAVRGSGRWCGSRWPLG